MTPFELLSRREREVAKLLLTGKSNKLIALSLEITERTVEFHLKNIYAKLQVSSRVELILKLRDSTVARGGEVAENGDRLKIRRWVTSFKEAVSIIGEELHMKESLNSTPGSDADSMTFFDSIRICMAKYAEFNGRASRSEFWWFTLFVTLVAAALTYLSQNLTNIFAIAMLLPQLAVGARRLHDIGKSPWWQLFLLVPIGGLVILGVLWAQPPTTDPLPNDKVPA
jgi:DNA-binding CsgD family transcriptional regulator